MSKSKVRSSNWKEQRRFHTVELKCQGGKQADKNEVGGMLGISAGFYSAANEIAPLFYGLLFQWLGAPVPFFLGGLILAVLWIVSPRAIKKNET